MAINLYIDNQLAVLDDSQEFSITINNQIIDKSGSFSYSISLALNNKFNNDIFGVINRHDISFPLFKKPFYIENNGVKIFAGDVVIVSINENYVDIQLLAEVASLNFNKTFSETYIDELNLGQLRSIRHILNEWVDGVGFVKPLDSDIYIYEAELRHCWNSELLNSSAINFLFFTNTETIAITYQWIIDQLSGVLDYDFNKELFFIPCRNLNDNNFDINLPTVTKNINTTYALNSADNLNIYSSTFNSEFPDNVIKYNDFARVYRTAPQLSFLNAINLVFQKLGYEINISVLNEDIFREMIIASAAVTVNIAECLPHWTVTEFITEIENFCNVRFFIDENNKEINIINRADIDKKTIVELNVIDEFETDSEFENISDFYKIDSYKYNLDSNQYNIWDNVTQDYIDLCTIVPINSISDIDTSVDPIENVLFKLGSKYLYAYKRDSSVLIRTVNVFSDRIGSDTEISLNIKPATIIRFPFFACNTLENPPNFEYYQQNRMFIGDGVVRTFQEWNSSKYDFKESFSLLSAVEEDSNSFNSDSKQESLLIILANSTIQNFEFFKGIRPYTDNDRDATSNPGLSYSLSLQNEDNAIGSKFISLYNKNVIYKKTFYANNIPDINDVFYIRGKKYIAASFVVKFSAAGMNHLIEGEFYLLD